MCPVQRPYSKRQLPYLSLDFGIVFPQLNLRSLIVFKFFVIMGIPLLFIAWFYLGASLNVDKWKARFDTNWGSTRAKVRLLCVTLPMPATRMTSVSER